MSRVPFQVSQNTDNFFGDRPSTRTHAPPGGGSQLSFLFGGSDEPDATRQGSRQGRRGNYNNQQTANIIGSEQPAAQAPAAGAKPKQTENDRVFGVRSGVSSNAYASGSNQNSGNVLTDKPITRLHAPPGGKSSIVLG